MKFEQLVKKTLIYSIKGVLPNQELMKALKLGQTKVVNGKTYVVKQTPSGKLDWRLKNKATKKQTKAKKTNVKIEDLFDDKDFPELDQIQEISDLGGSTGAKLVEDVNTGNKYVKKQGNSKEHVEEEFLVNSLYKLFGVNVPEMKLYKGNDESTLLSQYMPNNTAANDVMDDETRDNIAENYVLDCLLGNWDIYKNDNILINTDDGKLVRVDNGGGLRYSAQGRPKGDNFAPEVDELETMAVHNPYFAENLTDAQLKKQVKKILLKEENILSLVPDDLKEKMEARLDDLKDYISQDGKDPYRDLKERDLRKSLRKAGSVMASGPNGWAFLSEICKLRGFDKPPEILNPDDFEKEVAKDDYYKLNRGMTGNSGGSAQKYMTQFIEGEDCFYGNNALYGAGIYATVNASKKNETSNDDYRIALDYAGFDEAGVVDIALSKDANIADGDELDQMMNDEFFGEEFAEKKKEYDTANDEFYDLKKQKERFEDEIEEKVKEDLGWNEKTNKILNMSKPEEVYADPKKWGFNKPKRFFEKVVESINGSFTKVDNGYEVKLPNSGATFSLNPRVAQDSVKQKSPNSKVYNYHYKRMKQFIKENHFDIVKARASEEIKKELKVNPKIKKVQNDLKNSEKKIKDLANEIESIKTSGSGTTNEVMAEIIKRPGGTHRGFYAAIKGYDAIINKNGWDTNTDFAIILNRSKLKVKEFRDGK